MSRFQTLTPSTLSREAFVEAFADIYEHSPWVAEKAFDLGQELSLCVELLRDRLDHDPSGGDVVERRRRLQSLR